MSRPMSTFSTSAAMTSGRQQFNETKEPNMITQRLQLGQVVATPGAIEALKKAQQTASHFINRHLSGDWGESCEENRQLNDEAVENGDRVLSSYILSTGEKLWIITEADRSSTCLLLPSEY